MDLKNTTLAALAVATGLCAAATVSDATLMRSGQMKVKPVIDGILDKAEERGCSAWYGPISRKTGLMTLRYGMLFFGYGESGFYLATRTSRPTQPMSFAAGDRVRFALQPPGRTDPIELTIHLADGSNDFPEGAKVVVRHPEGVTKVGMRVSITESFVPYGALGVDKPADGEKWGLQASVDFTSPDETGCWHYSKTDASELGTFIPDSTAMIPSFPTFGAMESYRQTAWYKLLLCFRNDTGRDIRLSSRSRAHVGIGLAKLDSNPEEDHDVKHKTMQEIDGRFAKAGEYSQFRYEDVPLWPGNVNIFEADVSAEGRQLLKRRIAWDLGRGSDWKDAKGLPLFRTAFFPCAGNLLRVRYDLRSMRDKVVRAAFRVVGDKDGKTYWQEDIRGAPKVPANNVYTNHLPNLPLQGYTVRFVAVDDNGGKFSTHRTFANAKYPWQGLDIGKDRVILPPFKPIRAEGTRIDFLQTGYNCSGVLWDEITALGDNILAAPATLTLNGKGFTVTGAETVEASPDRHVRRVKAVSDALPELELVVTQTYDYDGFCDVTFAFSPRSKVKIESLKVSTPLRDSLCSLFEVQLRDDVRGKQSPDFALAKGEGEVWNSSMHVKPSVLGITKSYIQPYIWYGGVAKGLSSLLFSVKDTSLAPKSVTQRIIRDGGAATLEQDFVNMPVEWDSPKSFRIAFEPTPVKPRVWENAAFTEHMYSYQHPTNAVGFNTSFDSFWATIPIRSTYNVLPNDDDSLIRYCRANATTTQRKDFYRAVDEYIAKNAAWFRDNPYGVTAKDYRDKMTNGWRWTGIMHPLSYYNPLLISCFWPEYEMYKSEWYVGEWPMDDYYNEYTGRPSETLVDMMLYHMNRSVDLGAHGIFFDCYCLQCDFNFAASKGRAYILGKDDIQRSLGNIWEWRQLVKRTATMLYRKGVMVNGRPMVEVHATDGIIVPICAFAGSAMVTERGGKGGHWPDAFLESYTLTDITGLQCGLHPRPIVKTLLPGDEKEPQLRALMAWMCAYGIFNLVDQGTLYKPWFDKAWNTVFDFGWGKPGTTPVFSYTEDPKPVTHTGDGVRLTVARKKDSALLMFGNIGEETDVKFDISGLGFANPVLTDAMTGERICSTSFRFPRHDFRLIRVDSK